MSDEIENIQKTDHDTNSLFTIDVEHGMIHCGRAFMAAFTWAVAGSVTEKLYLKFPAGKECHFRFKLGFNDDIEYKIYEDGTYGSGGVVYPLINRKRHSSNTLTDLIISKEVTMSADGDQILGGFVGANRDYSALDAEHEIVYKGVNAAGAEADRVAMIEIINGAGICNVSVEINVYVPLGEGILNA